LALKQRRKHGASLAGGKQVEIEHDAIDDLAQRARLAPSGAEREEIRRELVELTYPIVSKFVAARSGDDLEVTEIVQETFFRAFRSFASWDRERGHFLSWLFRISFNCMNDAFRKLRREKNARRLIGTEPTAKSAVDQIDLRETVKGALAKLAKAQRDVVLLYHWFDLPAKDVSTILGMPEGTVRFHASEGRKELRRQLGDLYSKYPPDGSEE
jgi:RNA polymerase sigma-70 factor (ECF subfamily)